MDGAYQIDMLSDEPWYEQALCAGMDVEKFFDKYEENQKLASNIDKFCLGCPVIKECFAEGCKTESWGVWGGIYLIDGKVDKTRNSHKSKEIWERLYSVIKDDD